MCWSKFSRDGSWAEVRCMIEPQRHRDAERTYGRGITKNDAAD